MINRSIFERIKRLEQEMRGPEIITDVIMLENGSFMCNCLPSEPCEDEFLFELPVLVPPGCAMWEYCKEVYQKENCSKSE